VFIIIGKSKSTIMTNTNNNINSALIKFNIIYYKLYIKIKYVFIKCCK